MLLPTDVVATYPDDAADPSIALHQQHHDLLHAAVNTLVTAAPVNVLSPEYGVTGRRDHTAALQAALDDAAAQGRSVHLPRRPGNEPYLVGGDDVMLRLAPGVSISAEPGAVLKVKDGNGDFKAVLGGLTAAADLSGLTITGLTIDQNRSGNPVSSVKSLYTHGAQRFCLYVGAGAGITVQGCRFTGVDSLNVLYIGGAAMRDVRVQDCDVDALGESPARHDHSTFYLSADGLTVTGNRLRGVPGSHGAATAIETHGPNQVVTGNRVDGYRTGLIITGITGLGSTGVVVAHNTVSGALLGVQLWSYAGPRGGLRDVVVADNTVELDRDPWLGGAYDFPKGISLSPTSTDHVDTLRISGNVIRFGGFSAPALTGEYQANGIELYATDETRELRNFDISDNTVVGALGPGIRLQMRAVRGRVSGNRIVDPACSQESAMTSFWRSGLTFLDALTDVEVHGNRVVDTRSPHRLAQVLATSMTGEVVRSAQWDNTAVCLDGAVVPESVQTAEKRLGSRPAVPVAPRFGASLYYGPQGGRAVGRPADGQLTTVPFWVPAAQAWDRIGCAVTVAGTTRTVLRLGVYADDGTGRPGRLVLDAGTVSAATTGPKEAKIALNLPAGLYHLAMAAQGGSPQVRATSHQVLGSAGAGSLAAATGATPPTGWTMTGVRGALPTTFAGSGQTSTPGVVVLRAA